MLTFQQMAGQPLTWEQPKRAAHRYELRAGDTTLATLRWESAFHARAIAQTADGAAWSFERKGFGGSSVLVSSSFSTGATFKRFGWGSNGQLTLPDGRAWRWEQQGHWGTSWAWLGTDGQPLVKLQQQAGFFKMTGLVQIAPGAESLPELPLLVLLGWYLMVIMADDAATSAAVTAVVISAMMMTLY